MQIEFLRGVQYLLLVLSMSFFSACSDSEDQKTVFRSDSDLKMQVQTLFDDTCIACHTSDPDGFMYNDLALDSGFETKTVNVSSFGDVALNRIEPNSPEESYLFRKIEGTHQMVEGGSGDRMPLQGGPLSEAQIQLVRNYIQSFADRPLE